MSDWKCRSIFSAKIYSIGGLGALKSRAAASNILRQGTLEGTSADCTSHYSLHTDCAFHSSIPHTTHLYSRATDCASTTECQEKAEKEEGDDEKEKPGKDVAVCRVSPCVKPVSGPQTPSIYFIFWRLGT